MEKKKAVIYSMVALIALVILVVGATYAYFQNQYGSASNADVNVTTYTTDVLTFETGDAINISADQESFAQGKGNRTGSTFARATLQANNKTNSATANYYLYLNIKNNEFTYTKEGTPELILQVIDKATGNPVTSITSLNYVTVTDGNNTDIKGFDITDKSGLITLLDNKEISASPKTIEEYTVTITLVNHSFDQYNNTNKNFSGKLMIQKDEYILTATDVCPGKSLSDCVIAQYTGIKNSNIYYHDSNLTNGAGDNSYRYAGASDAVNNYVCFGSNVTPCPDDNLYRVIGVFDNKVGENQIEQRVKLIKSDYATSTLLSTDGNYDGMYTNIPYGFLNGEYKGNNLANIAVYEWDKTRENTWSLSNLNKTNLNTNFITNIGADWANKIDMTTWKVGGNTWSNIGDQPAKTVYQNEIVSPVITNSQDNAKEYIAKIGLMYVSDYMYAASQDKWTLVGSDSDSTKDYRAARSVNWMYMGLSEWTISRNVDMISKVFHLNFGGYLNSNDANNGFAVRPVFYLSSSVTYADGDGTQSSPIRLSD